MRNFAYGKVQKPLKVQFCSSFHRRNLRVRKDFLPVRHLCFLSFQGKNVILLSYSTLLLGHSTIWKNEICRLRN